MNTSTALKVGLRTQILHKNIQISIIHTYSTYSMLKWSKCCSSHECWKKTLCTNIAFLILVLDTAGNSKTKWLRGCQFELLDEVRNTDGVWDVMTVLQSKTRLQITVHWEKNMSQPKPWSFPKSLDEEKLYTPCTVQLLLNSISLKVGLILPTYYAYFQVHSMIFEKMFKCLYV